MKEKKEERRKEFQILMNIRFYQFLISFSSKTIVHLTNVSNTQQSV